MFSNGCGYKRSFTFRIVSLVVADLLTGPQSLRRKQRFWQSLAIAFDDLVCGIQDRLGRSIVLFQLDDLRSDKVVLKAEDDIEVRASE